MTSDLEELTALPDAQKEQLARSVLAALGIDVKRRQKDELIHACTVSGYHSDQDRNPTAALNVDNLLWHCLGCGTGGTVLWLIATLQHTSIEQAREWLHGEAGLTRAMDLPDLLALFDSLYAEKTRAPLPTYSPRMLERWQGIDGYILDDRQIPISTAIRMGICTDPDGFIGPPENRVRTGPRAVIPHWWQGRLVGWQSRRLPGADPAAPKYLSTPGFPREETVFAHDPAQDTVVVVESPMSQLRHQHHQPIEATFGADVTAEQIQHLARGRRKLIWFMDNDNAGWKAAAGRTFNGRFFPGAPQRAAAHCENWIVENPFAADPADMSDEMVDLLIAEHAVPWPVWQKPDQLYCHRCLQPSHNGACQ
ncbi:toprim domain-containing protein [Streptomyces albidoflavus]|uniref:toprim domain-containing protein n=1 Tax=Streptomyces albidoflavus TaxID=1886 RepID=UPI0033FB1727